MTCLKDDVYIDSIRHIEYNIDVIMLFGGTNMRTTINIPDNLVKEVEAVYKTESRSKSIEYALKDALLQKRLELLKTMTGKIEFDEKAINEARGMER